MEGPVTASTHLEPVSDLTTPEPVPDAERSSEAHGATVALAAVVAMLDPIAARRAAIRYAVVDRCVAAIEVDLDLRVEVLSAAVLAELGAVLASQPATGADSADLAASIMKWTPALTESAIGLRHQHERWDGSGSPEGLAGKSIPLVSRLVAIGSAVADVITGVSDEIPWPEAIQRLQDLQGTSLDPVITNAYLASIDRGSPARQHREIGVAQALDLLRQIRPVTPRPIEALTTIGAAIGAVDDPRGLVALIAEQARRSINATAVSVAKYNSDGTDIEVVVNIGELEPGQDRFPSNESHPFVRHDPSRVAVTALGSAPGQPASMLAGPINAGSTAWGIVLAKVSPDRAGFDATDTPILEAVAQELGHAVLKVERLAEVLEMALRDPLTGVSNRRVLSERLTAVFELPSSERSDAALIMCDLDGLKTINDTLGHGTGDQVLIKVAQTLRAAVATHKSASVFRIGGDEFCVLIESGGRLSAGAIYQRIEELIARIEDPPISLSCGMALASDTMLTSSELLRAADEAQYIVKRSRRGNQSPIRSDSDSYQVSRRSRRRPPE